MYVRFLSANRCPPAKPKVLLILQGVHHLVLYENIFRYCRSFDWYCLSPALPKEANIQNLYFQYGVRFFSDPYASLAHFAQFDCLITTWAIPHRKHLPYLKYIALAHELSIPSYELQHGLFQLGLTYYEESAVIGSRTGASTTAPAAANLTSEVLTWFGEGAIGYPRTSSFERLEASPPPPGCERITFVTNHHWAILSDDERKCCYAMMSDAIRTMPAVNFTLLPHTGEIKNTDFKAMIALLGQAGATNFHVETSRENGVFETILMSSNLIVASISTTLLDCELSGVPTVLFYNPSQDELVRSLESAVTVATSEALIDVANSVLYRTYRPALVTGFVQPFDPERLETKLKERMNRRTRPSPEDAAVVISRYVDTTA